MNEWAPSPRQVAFYNLICDEINGHPNLRHEIRDRERLDFLGGLVGHDDWVAGLRDQVGRPIKSDEAVDWILDRQDDREASAGRILSIMRGFSPKALIWSRDVVYAKIYHDATIAYKFYCRLGLVFLFFFLVEEAQQKLDRAIGKFDDWAFAHHVKGLALGLGDDADAARGELESALAKETFAEPKARIEAALAALG